MHTLLLADDSVTIQRLIELTFADQDISVVAFSDGDHAIASLSRTTPDIVLADIGMPGRSGYEVARYIKQTPGLSHIPVLLVTGAFEPVDQERVREIGCDGVLTKPFEPQLVISRVKELLTKAGHENGDSHAGTGQKLDKSVEIENYFEQLDQAFASLAGAPSPAPPSHEPLPVPPVAFSEPLRSAAPVPPAPARHDTHPSPPSLGGPGLADAFAALLTAEDSGDPQAAAFPTLAEPLPEPSVSLDDIVDQVTARVLAKLSDGMLRDAATNVLAPTAERTVNAAIADVVTPIAERVVRSAIADIVSTTAERLVREEIDRIKSNIK